MRKDNYPKAVVTGGAGFIGSHLVEGLFAKGYQVTVIDDLSTGTLENLYSTGIFDQIEFIKGSVTDEVMLKKVFKGARYVFHQGAIPSVPRSIKKPLPTNEVNVTGTLKVLESARQAGIKKVVYASSSSVYGDTPSLPKHEDMLPLPMSPYAVSKLSGEYYCRVYTAVHNLPTVSLRYFNVFGPRQSAESEYAAVIPKFIQALKENRRPVIFGDGNQTRDFSFVKDVVKANISAAESKASGIFNTGSGNRVSINRLAEIIIGIFNQPGVKPEHEAQRAGDVLHSLADISRANAFLGYHPEYSLEEGLGITVSTCMPGR